VTDQVQPLSAADQVTLLRLHLELTIAVLTTTIGGLEELREHAQKVIDALVAPSTSDDRQDG
jgi:hypothetical protein